MVAKGWLFAEAMVGKSSEPGGFTSVQGQRKRKPNHDARRGNPPCHIEALISIENGCTDDEKLRGHFRVTGPALIEDPACFQSN
ncbi:hypothetical protein RBSH_00922 [Rhodopirellula baltica SH28]|uniref:Uncharacterized protein n=1 Tax=Rhodopirellula baltica SH28 TaxID=993517 RepID=K5DMW8_RHOBT|nr:hypothetical protein RBSH_00922 [Rhodopirellula baltica SH28]